jgi:hypothetical protein
MDSTAAPEGTPAEDIDIEAMLRAPTRQAWDRD